jgi:SAM-dependent methyltransferase
VEHAEFTDPRLVTVYDVECLWSRDDDFFLGVVSQRGPARIVDLGCGTGRLAIGMATAGHHVTGVDPARASLAAARGKPGAELVTWIEGKSDVVPDESFDAAVMTSHVAQFLCGDDEWATALGDLRRALVPGGILTFESRDPADRAWERWNPTDSLRRLSLPDGEEVSIFTEVTAIEGELVTFSHHYRFADGDELHGTATLRFRPEATIRESLHAAGFTVDHIFGGWDRQPVGEGDGEFIVIARV